MTSTASGGRRCWRVPDRATGHGEVAERAIAARRRGTELAEKTLAAAEAVVADAPAATGASVRADGPLGLAAGALSARLGDLAAHMRASGARVGVGEVLAAHRALAAVDPTSRADAFYALRAALCSSRVETMAFASAFNAVFAGEREPSPLDDLGEIAKAALPRVAVPPSGEEAEARDLTPAPSAWSEEELLREKDFAEYTESERAVARRLRARRAGRGPLRRSRRTVPTRRRREEHDLRATF